jgi:hypothetical protein
MPLFSLCRVGFLHISLDLERKCKQGQAQSGQSVSKLPLSSAIPNILHETDSLSLTSVNHVMPTSPPWAPKGQFDNYSDMLVDNNSAMIANATWDHHLNLYDSLDEFRHEPLPDFIPEALLPIVELMLIDPTSVPPTPTAQYVENIPPITEPTPTRLPTVTVAPSAPAPVALDWVPYILWGATAASTIALNKARDASAQMENPQVMADATEVNFHVMRDRAQHSGEAATTAVNFAEVGKDILAKQPRQQSILQRLERTEQIRCQHLPCAMQQFRLQEMLM